MCTVRTGCAPKMPTLPQSTVQCFHLKQILPHAPETNKMMNEWLKHEIHVTFSNNKGKTDGWANVWFAAMLPCPFVCGSGESQGHTAAEKCLCICYRSIKPDFTLSIGHLQATECPQTLSVPSVGSRSGACKERQHLAGRITWLSARLFTGAGIMLFSLF